jgi:hypothetical protein
MKNLLSIVVLPLIICLVSCKKDKKTEPTDQVENTSTAYPDYSNLKVGNYWIYERFSIDGLGNTTPLAIIDSCYIEKDTIIHGNMYYKYLSPQFGWLADPTIVTPYSAQYFRDSLSYTVDSGGRIEFSSQDFNAVFLSGYTILGTSDTAYQYSYKMVDRDVIVNTPLGNYLTCCFRENYLMYPNYNAGGTNRNRNTRYAKNIGKITQNGPIYAGMPTQWERRLIRYHSN